MAAQGTITPNANGTVRFDTRCMLCSRPSSIDGLDPKAVAAWQAGEFVQFAFPDLGDDKREILVSGSHPACFDAAFADDEDDFPEYELP